MRRPFAALPSIAFGPRLRWLLPLSIAALAAGCSTERPWINQPATQATATQVVAPERSFGVLVAVTLSGGGARAAAFGYGVLRELQQTGFVWDGRQTDLLAATDVVSGVSGGSILAAYYAAFGPRHLADFEPDFLRQNIQNSLLLQLARPYRLWELTSPWLGRSHLLARRFDALYHGRTFADLKRNPDAPRLVIAATDLSLGTGFDFTQEQFALICSDLDSVPLSFAVAASSAVPMLLSPMTLRNHAADCRNRAPRPLATADTDADYRTRLYRSGQRSYLDAAQRPYIHLVDGGLSDNLGIRRLLDRALAQGGLRQSLSGRGMPAGSIEKLVLITVNSERDPENDIDQSSEVPGTAQVADALLFGAGARQTTETQELLSDVVREWREELRRSTANGASDAFAPDAELHLIAVNLRDAQQGDAPGPNLLQVPTSLSIADAEVTGLIEAGRSVLRRSEAFRRLQRSLGIEPAPDAAVAR